MGGSNTFKQSDGGKVFLPVDSPKQIIRIFESIIEAEAGVICRFDNRPEIHLIADHMDEEFFYCRGEGADELRGTINFQFFLDDIPYFGRGLAKEVDAKNVGIQIPRELHLVQRRQSYRIPVPTNYQAIFQMTSPSRYKCSVLDLSAGGISILVPKVGNEPSMSIGRIIEGELQIIDRDPLAISGIIRRRNLVEGDLVIGLEFTKLIQKVEMRMLSFVMEIYRDAYSKEKGLPKRIG